MPKKYNTVYSDSYDRRENTKMKLITSGSKNLKLITLLMPRRYLKEIETYVNLGYAPNRAEFIRFAIRDSILLYREAAMEQKI